MAQSVGHHHIRRALSRQSPGGQFSEVRIQHTGCNIPHHARGALFSDPQWLTVSEYPQRWLADTAKYRVAASTCGRYERTVRNHFLSFFGRLRLRDMSATRVRVLKAKKLGDGMNPNTVGVMQGVLPTALNHAVYGGLYPPITRRSTGSYTARGRTPSCAPSSSWSRERFFPGNL